jgi:hypothetical protein
MAAAALQPPALRRNPAAARVALLLTTRETALLYALTCQAEATGTLVTAVIPTVEWDTDKDISLVAGKLYVGLYGALVRGSL